MNFLLTTKKLNTSTLSSLEEGGSIVNFNIGSLNVIKDDAFSYSETESYNCFWDGYVNDYTKISSDITSQIESVFDSIAIDWPVKDNISGSFSATLVNKQTNEVIICNDSIGLYPLYYLKQQNEIYISNSIIWLGTVSKCEKDEIGVFQRSFGPEFSNIGSRTILKNCKRLLPGEWIKLSPEGKKVEIKYDNSLYQNISDKKVSKSLTEEYWEALKKELEYCSGGTNRINLALSGGLDSRLILGGLSSSKSIRCHTYGNKDNYETNLAKRLAVIKNADFKSYSEPDLNFPPLNILRKYTSQTEAVYLCAWFEILENVYLQEEEVFLLGDMTESLQGRNLKLKNINYKHLEWKYHLTFADFPFRNNLIDLFNSWKIKILKTYLKWCKNINIQKLNLSISEEDLIKGVQDDLQEIFLRIESHRLQIFELNEELFSWYTHARHPMGRQVLLCNHKFKSYCPAMSIQMLRFTSNIHPNIRINSRFMKVLFSKTGELKELGKIPTSQIPLIPLNWSNLIRLPMWFIRSKMDNYFIKRMMKSQNTEKTYRLFKSNNWAKVYQNPDLEKNLDDYFRNNHLGKAYVKNIRSRALERRDLKQWPFANMDIINAAALNAELDLIASFREQDEV